MSSTSSIACCHTLRSRNELLNGMPVLPSSDMPSHFPNVFTGCREPLNQGGKPLPGAKPRTPNHNYELRTTNYQLPTTNHQLLTRPVHQPSHRLVVARARGCVGRKRRLELLDLGLRQLHGGGARILLDILHPLRAWNRNDVLSLPEQPREREP